VSTDLVRNGANGAGHGGPARGYSWEPFQSGNEIATMHGATSERRIRPLARNHRRRVLRQIGLRASELDPAAKAYLEHYARLTAKVVLIDRYLDEVGVLDTDGNPRACMTLYVRLHRAALSALSRLEGHLDRKAPSLEQQLAELRRGA
jgi:hypothetical protein